MSYNPTCLGCSISQLYLSNFHRFFVVQFKFFNQSHLILFFSHFRISQIVLREIPIALEFSFFNASAEHKYFPNIVMLNHPPEVIKSKLWNRSLTRYCRFTLDINHICIDVIIYTFMLFQFTNLSSGRLKGHIFWISV